MSMGPVTRGSIRRRLLGALLAGAAVLAVVVYGLVVSVARQVAQDSQDNILTASALSILESARFSGGQINVDLPYSALSMLDSISDERVFYAIRLGDEVLSGYADLPEATLAGSGAVAFRSARFLGEEVRVTTQRRSMATDVGQRLLQVSVAQTLSGQKQVLADISRNAIAIGAGIFLLLVLLAAVIARSTIRPLDRLASAVSERGPRDLRPFRAAIPAEMGPLVGALNSLMRRLEVSLLRSEDFITEAAHRLRTPLAIVRTKAEIIQRKSQSDATRAQVQEMIHAIDESSRTAGQLLDHAMVMFRLDNLTDEEVELRQLTLDTIERLRPVSDLAGIALGHGELARAHLRGDPILLQSALHNVLDNAIKYAGHGAQVDVCLDVAGARARLSVVDSGPGFPDADSGALSERFARGANAAGVVGSGLGLTIVKEVIKAHGGHLETTNTTGGGACVTLFLPLS